MTLVVEDGTGLDNANSYASLAQGDAYHETSLYADVWTNATSEQKQLALAFATKLIDMHWIFRSGRTTTTQALDWPRVYVPVEEALPSPIYDGSNILAGLAGYGSSWYQPIYASNVIPPRLIAAVCECARTLLTTNRTLFSDLETRGLASMGIGSGALSFTFNASDRRTLFTEEVQALLSPLGTLAKSNTGYRQLVRR